MALYERFDVLEREVSDLIKQLKVKIERLNQLNEAISNVLEAASNVENLKKPVIK